MVEENPDWKNYCLVLANDSDSKPIQFVSTQDEWSKKWNKSTLSYTLIGEGCRTMNLKSVRRALNLATQTWEIECGIKCVGAWKDVNADIRLEFRNQTDDDVFSKRASVLAYAYFPSTSGQGKIVFNDDYIWTFHGNSIKAQEAYERGFVKKIGDPKSKLKTYSIIAVMIHELGHTFGLTHDVSGNESGVDVMDAYYSGKNRFELSSRDIQRIRAKYGKREFSSSSFYQRLKDVFSRLKHT